jgi:hypothetical protein
MSGLDRLRRAARRSALRFVPPARRDWVEAVWAEASDVPPGMRRLTWRAGGLRLLAREALMRRGIGSAMLFAAAAALAVWAAWPGSQASFATSVDRMDVVTTVILLGCLALVARWFPGSPGQSRLGRWLRIGTFAAILVLVPAKNVVEQVLDAPPHAGTDLRLYRLISGPGFGNHWRNEILYLVVMALYAAVILWLTSQRSRVAPVTLVVGTVAGAALGAAWYLIGPLGFGGAPATNPWLPGSDIAPFIVLAVILLFGCPVTAMAVADRRSAGRGRLARPTGARIRQMLAAALLTALVGALSVTVAGTGTIAAMLTAPWLRNWLYHGHRLSGVARLQFLVRGNPAALTYSHQITAAADAPAYLIICLIFPLTALVLAGLGALALATAEYGRSDQAGGGGGSAPEVIPDPPGGVQLADSSLA